VVTFPEGSGHPRFSSADDADAAATGTVDAFVEQMGLRPTFVKVDVEGAEYFVLRGMRATLRTWRPRLMLEVHPAWQPEGVAVAVAEALLIGAGYERTGEQADALATRQWWRPTSG
jgi:hypothetical protein